MEMKIGIYDKKRESVRFNWASAKVWKVESQLLNT